MISCDLEVISRAASHLGEHEWNGTRARQIEGYEGAPHLHIRTVDEMVEEKEVSRANALAASKGRMANSTW